MLGVASGAVAGLVAITPAAGFVGPMPAIAIGLIAGAVCFGAVLVKARAGYDDSLDAFGVHGVGGALGALLTGVFAAKAWGAPADGALHGGLGLVGTQALGVAAAAGYAAAMTFVILKIIDRTIGLRVAKDVEREGLDGVLHGESGYEMGGQGYSAGDGGEDEPREGERVHPKPAGA
jgi:ammonium transporter, Amt family